MQKEKGGQIKKLEMFANMFKYTQWRYIMNTSNITNYKPKEFAELIGVSFKTLQRWDREGALKANRTPTDRRYYIYDQYLQFKATKTENYNEESQETLYMGCDNQYYSSGCLGCGYVEKNSYIAARKVGTENIVIFFGSSIVHFK